MYKKFKELSDIEQGALLLAHLRGEPIEMLSNTTTWILCEKPQWEDHHFYRIKPPIRLEFSNHGGDALSIIKEYVSVKSIVEALKEFSVEEVLERLIQQR